MEEVEEEDEEVGKDALDEKVGDAEEEGTVMVEEKEGEEEDTLLDENEEGADDKASLDDTTKDDEEGIE